jgi:hypothetical protein
MFVGLLASLLFVVVVVRGGMRHARRWVEEAGMEL